MSESTFSPKLKPLSIGTVQITKPPKRWKKAIFWHDN